MKNFLGTFAISFIMCFAFIFFGGELVFKNFWAMLIIAALIISILITLFVNQETRIEKLELRIKTLESKSEPKE